jgi:exopolysaccharide biosynthesis WecB/TagA/CpsF family protein
LRIIAREPQCEALIEECLALPRSTVLSFLNAHALNVSWISQSARNAFQQSDVLLLDGSGMALLMRFLGTSPGMNMNGTDLIPRILAKAGGRKVAIYGTTEPYLGRAAAALRGAGVDVIGTLDGFREIDAYEDDVRLRRPDIVILAMGMPKQEICSVRLREAAVWPCLIINGGAIADFLGGKVERAPKMLRSLGMEWTFRLAQEPRRLFYRYVVGGFLFAARGTALVLRRIALRGTGQDQAFW